MNDGQALKESREKFSELANSITDVFFAMDADLRYIYWNRASEKLTGISAKDAIGKSILEVFPDNIQTRKAVVIYQEVLKTQKPKTFINEFHLKGKKYHFEIAAYPLLNGLSVFVRDITERKLAQEREKQNIQDLQNLSKTAMDFVELPPDADIYQHIAEQLKKLVGNSIVIVNSFDPETDLTCVRAIIGMGKLSKSTLQILGKNPVGTTYKINEIARSQLLTGKYHKLPGKIHTLSFGQIPKPICHALETLFKITEIYSMGFTWKGELLGNIVIIVRKDTNLKNRKVIEAFINQAAVALQRKRVEETLGEVENKYRDLFETSPDAIILLDSEFKILDYNEAAAKIGGVSREKENGKYFGEVISAILGERKEEYLDHFVRTLQGENVAPFEVNINNKKGETYWLETYISPMKINDEILGLHIIAHDITKRKKAKEELKHRLELEKTISNISSQFVTCLDFDDAINASLAEMCRFNGANHAYMFLFHEDVRIMNNKYEWYANRENPQINSLQNISFKPSLWWINKLRKGEPIHIKDFSKMLDETNGKKEIFESQDIKQLLALPLNVNGKLKGFIGFDNVVKTGEWTYIDLALLQTSSEIIANALERKHAEKELLQSKKLASIGQLATAVAHEINNPLTNISFLTANLSEMTDAAEILKKLDEISNQRKIATDIVQSLQNFSRKIEPKFGSVDITDSIIESLKLLEGNRPGNIVVVNRLKPNQPYVRADPEQMRQVFVNIIKNAFEAMPKGGTLTISAELKNSNSLEIHFEDTGIGIAKENISNVFTPFFTLKGVNKGLGLGLTICQGIVEAHKGSIEVESEEGKGSTFIITLPLG